MASGETRARTPAIVLSGLALGVVAISIFGSKPLAPTLVPPVGFEVAEPIRSALQNGGDILVLSEDCDICIARLRSYENLVRRVESPVVLIQRGEGTALEEALAVADREERGVWVLSREEVVRTTGVQAYPVHLSIDESGRVQSSSVSRQGWLRSVGGPVAWGKAWVRLLSP